MSRISEYKDIMAFHPGYYIADIIEDMGINQAEFATRMGTTAKTLSQLLNGQASISNDLAKKLSVMTGTSVNLWQNLQNEYDKKIIEIQQDKDFDEQISIVKEIDYKYFVDVVGLPPARNMKEKVANLCKALMISDLRINSKAWVQVAMNIAKEKETKSFDAAKLKNYLPELRGMTVKKPSEFLARMDDIFAECGVAFVVLPHLKNSGVNGAVKWIKTDKVMLAMNNRGLDADKFWFSLFHEVRHVLQQKVKTIFISSTTIEEMMDLDQKLEIDADEFSRNFLIPAKDYKRFSPNKFTTDSEIIAFAKSIGIHPGIVAGRLQHDHVIELNRCVKLKEKYVIICGR